jgi:riboflavin kinase, archaea type
MAILRGRVVTGVGSFSYWIEKLQDHYERKTGMRLFPGTLNLELDEPYSLPGRVIRLEGWEYDGSVSVNIVPCSIRGLVQDSGEVSMGDSIQGRNGFILRTDANEEGRGHHPKTIVEVATDVKLRDYFDLRDGDLVEIETFEGSG